MKNTSYENMDPELRKEVARDKVKKTTLVRILIAALMICMMVYLKLTGIAAVIMVAVALYIVLSMIPVWSLINKNMKFRDEEEKTE